MSRRLLSNSNKSNIQQKELEIAELKAITKKLTDDLNRSNEIAQRYLQHINILKEEIHKLMDFEVYLPATYSERLWRVLEM